ncbi:MAG: glutamine--tRNA ligase/YqeY domain fusion protein [Spirochaetes bacterium]|nr:glutamine--tRNA ligase/YqeY domain fusion protein [Spirochaetota bacterium]
MSNDTESSNTNFIREIIAADVKNNKNNGNVVTRFPPEPNGYLHIGHMKGVNVSFSMAKEFSGIFHLRFDDTNPAKEEKEYMESIMNDIKWMGFDWGEHLYFASDYFDQMYEYALELIRQGKAYVDELSAEEIREYRGTLTQSGKNSPYRDRPIEENLDLFKRMKAGEFEDGKYVLRAKIDMASPNINLRDPVMYRIQHAHHYRQGDKWNIYPMYDWAHGLEDSIEGVTHSICSLEFEDHRPLYDWFLDQLPIHHPQQIEYARLNMTYTLMSKRKLLKLVKENYVDGWDDPRMTTIAGLRRRGYTPSAIKDFLNRSGVAKTHSTSDIALLEHCIREELNKTATRVMGVLRPLKVIITNYPEGQTEQLDADNNPEDPNTGTRKITFSREVYIEQDDFMEDPPRKYFRLAPGREIRLKHAYYIKCENVIKDESTGEILEIHCTYDPETKGGWSKDGRKVKGTSHWVSAVDSVEADVVLYDRLFSRPDPESDEAGKDFTDYVNPESKIILNNCLVEKSLKNAEKQKGYQFLRQGYFCLDHKKEDGTLVFNRTVSLKDSWAKIMNKMKKD